MHRTLMAAITISLSAVVVSAQVQPPAPTGNPANGKNFFMPCLACHGADAGGQQLFNAPRLAGQAQWYLQRQLAKFKKGVRGYHAKDLTGMQMAPMAQLLPSDEIVADVTAYIGSLKPAKPVDKTVGDVQKGKQFYLVCVPCHGDKGQGVFDQKGPNLAMQHGWYMVRQITNFKEGIRGQHDDDVEGKLMHPITLTLPNEQAIKDVVAYIHTLAAK